MSLLTPTGGHPRTRLEYARRLRDAGLSVFPIPYGSKVPLVSWKPLQERFSNDDELREWFPLNQVMNLGIVTGTISGLVVIDADTSDAVTYLWKQLPHTPWQTQTAHGRHFYYAHPGGRITNRGTDLVTPAGAFPIHVRADGGFVIGHGSCHPSGKIYRSSVDAPRPSLPIYSPDWLPKETRETNSSPREAFPLRGDTSDQLLLRARRYLEAIPPPIIGQGSDTITFKAACRLTRGFGLDTSDAEQLLWEWCGGRAGWTREWVAAKVENASYGKEPIGGLR